jgi:hypothetical protein
MAIPPEDLKRLEEMGEARVRLEFNTNAFGKSALQIFAAQWLAELDEATRKRAEARHVEETARSRSTLIAAWIAAIGTIVSIILMFALWDHPRR